MTNAFLLVKIIQRLSRFRNLYKKKSLTLIYCTKNMHLVPSQFGCYILYNGAHSIYFSGPKPAIRPTPPPPLQSDGVIPVYRGRWLACKGRGASGWTHDECGLCEEWWNHRAGILESVNHNIRLYSKRWCNYKYFKRKELYWGWASDQTPSIELHVILYCRTWSSTSQ